MIQWLQEKFDLSTVGTIANIAGMILLGLASAFKNRADAAKISRARHAKALSRRFNILFIVSLAFGGLVGGFGLWSLAYWSEAKAQEHWQSVEAKISEFYSDLHAAKQEVSPDSSEAKRVEELGYDFQTWAQDFVTTGRPKRLQALPRSQLNEDSLREVTNLQFRSYYQRACAMISEICNAYNQVHDHKITVTMAEIPADISRAAKLGTVDFDDGNVWEIVSTIDYPFKADTEPQLWILLKNNKNQIAHGIIEIHFIPTGEGFYFKGSVYGFPESVSIETKGGQKFDAAFAGLLQRVFEVQVITRH